MNVKLVSYCTSRIGRVRSIRTYTSRFVGSVRPFIYAAVISGAGQRFVKHLQYSSLGGSRVSYPSVATRLLCTVEERE